VQFCEPAELRWPNMSQSSTPRDERVWSATRSACTEMPVRLAVLLSIACAMGFGGCKYRDDLTSQAKGPVIVFRGSDGRSLSLDELQGVTGKVRWELVGGANVPAEATRLHQQAREAGGRGQYATAIALLTQASRLAPNWPYPIYDRAYSRLLTGDVDAARADYQKTVELAPRGFFTAITALDALAREQKGDLPPGTYLAYLSLEWTNDRVTKTDLVRQLVEMVPRFAPAWMEWAMLLDQDSERLVAIDRGLTVDPDAETRGMLLVNRALVLNRQGNRDAAARLLGELALSPTSTLASEQLAKATLATLITK
jgi:tetratricopeptide (TPR) repeat protein